MIMISDKETVLVSEFYSAMDNGRIMDCSDMLFTACPLGKLKEMIEMNSREKFLTHLISL